MARWKLWSTNYWREVIGERMTKGWKIIHGITLAVLIIMIAVIIILATIMVNVSISGIDMAAKTKLKTEIAELETAVIERFSNYSLNELNFPLVGDEISVEDAVTAITGSTSYEADEIRTILENDILYVRKMDSSHIESFGIENVTGNSYIVDYKTAMIYGPIQ